MATLNPNEVVAPVVQAPVATAPVTNLATSATPAQVAPTLESISSDMGVSLAPQFQANVENVFSTSNIKQASYKPKTAKQLEKMNVDKLAKELSKAQNFNELQQIEIGNKPMAMNVITGQQAHMNKLNSYYINALSNIKTAKEAELARKEAERQSFISQYGADPEARPSGMSKREFRKALGSGKFQELLTPKFQESKIDLAFKKKQLSGSGSSETKSGVLSILNSAANMPSGGREWAAQVAENLYGSEGKNIVSSYTAQNGWEKAFNQNFGVSNAKPHLPYGKAIKESDGTWQYFQDGTRERIK